VEEVEPGFVTPPRQEQHRPTPSIQNGSLQCRRAVKSQSSAAATYLTVIARRSEPPDRGAVAYEEDRGQPCTTRIITASNHVVCHEVGCRLANHGSSVATEAEPDGDDADRGLSLPSIEQRVINQLNGIGYENPADRPTRTSRYKFPAPARTK
jgi:hypothetical protein